MYKVLFTKRANKEKKLLRSAGLEGSAKKLLDMLVSNPLQSPPFFEKLSGDLKGYYSRRINIQHRLIYAVDEVAKIVIVRSMWTHYE